MAAVSFPRNAAKALATVTQPSRGIYLLSMHNLPDNRLTPDFIKTALLPALTHVELAFRRDWAASADPKDPLKQAALILTGERQVGKFFSNGLQLELVPGCPGFFRDVYYVLLAKLLTFPMYTVSAINGHAFAGGFCLSLCTDKRVMRAERAWLSMNEILFGAPIPVGMNAVLQQRLSPSQLSETLLTAKRWTASEALEGGIVEEVVKGDSEATIARAVEVAKAHAPLSATGVMGIMKQTMYANVLEGLKFNDELPTATLKQKNEQEIKKLSEGLVMSKL